MAPTKLSGPNLCLTPHPRPNRDVISYYTIQNFDLTSRLEVKQGKEKRKATENEFCGSLKKKKKAIILLRGAFTGFQVSTDHVAPSVAATVNFSLTWRYHCHFSSR